MGFLAILAHVRVALIVEYLISWPVCAQAELYICKVKVEVSGMDIILQTMMWGARARYKGVRGAEQVPYPQEHRRTLHVRAALIEEGCVQCIMA